MNTEQGTDEGVHTSLFIFIIYFYLQMVNIEV
jgi:hypothetical protein